MASHLFRHEGPGPSSLPICPTLENGPTEPGILEDEGTVYPRDVVPTVGWVQASRVGQGARLRKTSH